MEQQELKKFLRRPDVMKITGFKRSTLRNRVIEGDFPAPYSMGGREVAWKEDEVMHWMESRPKVAYCEANQ